MKEHSESPPSSSSSAAPVSKRTPSKQSIYTDTQLACVAPNTTLSSPLFCLSDQTPSLNQIFSTRRPRDVTAGLSSGIKSVGKGIGLGAISLIAAPVYGAAQHGVGGFFKGLGAGITMAVALPVAGVSVGLTQAARGVFNTPEAIIECRAGKKWDKKKREWIEHWYSLDEEHAEIQRQELSISEQKLQASCSATDPKAVDSTFFHPRKVVDTTFYDVLGVSTSATQAEIRKSYYRLALACHPDKHVNDPQAQERFQQLGEAYQVLGEEKRRHEYDLHGKDAAQNMSIIDAGLFFTMLFGSDVFQPYIGMLKMAMFVETFDNLNTPGQVTENIMEFEQRKREVALAILLRERLQGWVNQPEKKQNQWKEKMQAEARDLCTKSFGDAFVEAIGWAYYNYSTQFLGKLNSFMGVGGRLAKFQAAHREMGNVWRMAGSAVRASIAARRLQKSQDRREKFQKTSNADQSDTNQPQNDAEQKAHVEGVKQLEETLPLILQTMLQICLMDVEATVRKASKKALKDMSANLEVRRQRATGLMELGKIFREVAERHKQSHKKPVDVMRHVEDALLRAAAEADKKNAE